jgi:hypothetical protein
VGASRLLVDGHLATSHSAWLTGALRAGGLLAFTLVVVLSLGRRGPLHTAWSAVAGREWAVARAPLLAFLAVYLVLTNLLWMYHDRYYLALAPPLIALLLGVPDLRPRLPRAALGALALFGVIALVGTSDALRFNQAVGDAWESLVDAGVPPADIDAGYAWNGWRLYAHPTNLDPGMSPLADVPWVTSARHPEYAISTSPLDGYAVERSMSWPSLPWPGPDRLLVLKKIMAAGVTDPAHAGPAQ